MRAMVLTAPEQLIADEVARPRPDEGQVLVRVTHSGICGTDFKIYNGAIPVSYPRIMGHEMTGEVVDAGGTSVRAGERVIIDPGAVLRRVLSLPNRTDAPVPAAACSSGATPTAASPSTWPRRRATSSACPQSIDSRSAPLIQVLTTCVHAQRQIQIFPGESVAVLGLGVTGQLHVQLAKARGASPVIGVTRSAHKRELAETLGADLTIPGGDGAIDRCERRPRVAAPTWSSKRPACCRRWPRR